MIDFLIDDIYFVLVASFFLCCFTRLCQQQIDYCTMTHKNRF